MLNSTLCNVAPDKGIFAAFSEIWWQAKMVRGGQLCTLPCSSSSFSETLPNRAVLCAISSSSRCSLPAMMASSVAPATHHDSLRCDPTRKQAKEKMSNCSGRTWTPSQADDDDYLPAAEVMLNAKEQD